MLKQVRFSGIKSLNDVTLLLTPFTVLVGPNGCGKSTLLDQIAVLCAATWVTSSTNSFGSAGEVLGKLPLNELRTSGAPSAMLWRGTQEDARWFEMCLPGTSVNVKDLQMNAFASRKRFIFDYRERPAFDSFLRSIFHFKSNGRIRYALR